MTEEQILERNSVVLAMGLNVDCCKPRRSLATVIMYDGRVMCLDCARDVGVNAQNGPNWLGPLSRKDIGLLYTAHGWRAYMTKNGWLYEQIRP